MARPALAVLEYHLVGYRRVWRGSVFSSFVLPVLILLGFGVSVGRYVGDSDLGVPYVDYIAPGVLAATLLQVAAGECTWPVYAQKNWMRTYDAMRATPVRLADIVTGHFLLVTLRLASVAVAFLLVMVAFDTVHSGWAVAAVPAGVLTGLALATPVFAYSLVITSDTMFALLYRFLVIPLTLFSGVFFEVSTMPFAARLFAYLSPLWHGVELCRAATLGTATAWGVWPHTAYLLLWSVGGFVLAQRVFRQQMGD